MNQNTFRKHHIRIVAFKYLARDPNTGAVTECEAIIPTHAAVAPKLKSLWDETLELAKTIRRLRKPDGANESQDEYFVLVDGDRRVVGSMCLSMQKLSDGDLAWIACILAELEGAAIGWVPKCRVTSLAIATHNSPFLKQQKWTTSS